MTASEWQEVMKDVVYASRILQQSLRSKTLSNSFNKVMSELTQCQQPLRATAVDRLVDSMIDGYRFKFTAVMAQGLGATRNVIRRIPFTDDLLQVDPARDVRSIRDRATAVRGRLRRRSTGQPVGVLATVEAIADDDIKILRSGINLVASDAEYIKTADKVEPADAVSLFLGYLLLRFGGMRVFPRDALGRGN